MVIGYKYFLRKVAGLLESGDNLTIGSASRSLNMKPDEFKQMLALMENNGDIELCQENNAGCCTVPSCGRGCSACSYNKDRTLKVRSYRMTESGMNKIKWVLSNQETSAM